MNTIFRIEQRFLKAIQQDLSRHHSFALERVGFIACRVGQIQNGFSILAERYFPVGDDDYEDGHEVGAMLGAAAIRKALQVAYNDRYCMIHVHRHDHHGMPRFSNVDLSESAKLIPNFWNVRPELPHGTVVLSFDAMAGMAWDPRTKGRFTMRELTSVGRPTGISRGFSDNQSAATKLSR